MRRNPIDEWKEVGWICAVSIDGGNASLLDVCVLFLVILQQGCRLIAKGSLADLISFRDDGFTRGDQKRNPQKYERPHGDRSWHGIYEAAGGDLGPRFVVCWKMHLGQV